MAACPPHTAMRHPADERPLISGRVNPLYGLPPMVAFIPLTLIDVELLLVSLRNRTR
jgi:hypothetical protein